ncbi:MAG: 3-hydroxyacyl-CoA dehydrogenase/enoyl-CoA hydratase family protein [Clostridiales bacterium]|nr:3-hydroxyacyl-CoA dehydrogenase/enoyl-CoA hydratase family protein [Clostridiales bacterium]
MSKIVTKACVIGSGVMGANIAALLASVGMQVTLLDIVPFNGLNEKEKAAGLTEDSLEFRNRLVNDAVVKLKRDKQMPLLSKSALKNIRVGNTTDHLNLMEDADWIIEVVVERLDIKKVVLKQIEAHAKPDAIISSNTSGVSITQIVEDMNDDFKARFMGTHFFNPPRWMGLFEMIPTQWTSKETFDTMEYVGGTILGKTCVYAKDTPNFIGNRIGCYGAAQVMQLTEKYDYDFATVDYITGPVMGHPKTATFGTGDMVGMDIIANVSKNVIDSSKDEKEIAEYTMPKYVIGLMEKGWLGNKTKQGFFKKDVIDGKRVKYQYNYKTDEYELIEGRPSLDTVKAALKSDNKYEAMAYGEEKECKFYWDCIKGISLYSAKLVPEIADDFREIDKAIRTGYNWEEGPFQVWDKIGVRRSVERMQAEGETVPQWVLDMLAKGQETFYTAEDAKFPYIKISETTVVEENDDCTIRDIGDGVLGLELHCTGNAIGPRVGEMVSKAMERMDKEDWKGMVIGNDGKMFSAGADLLTIWQMGTDKEFKELEELIRTLQAATGAMRYSKKPIVAAPFGQTLGGGCEMMMHCPNAVAFSETYSGLVEVGVGLIPAGGGSTELTRRLMDRCFGDAKNDRYNAIATAFQYVATAKVNMSANEAIDNGFLNKGTLVAMSRDNLIDLAKREVLTLSDRGYMPPVKQMVKVTGEYGYGMLLAGIEMARGSGQMSEHDEYISKFIAKAITGGDVPYGTEMSVEQLHDIECEGFLALAGTEKTQDRIMHMLSNGKPLRN